MELRQNFRDAAQEIVRLRDIVGTDKQKVSGSVFSFDSPKNGAFGTVLSKEYNINGRSENNSLSSPKTSQSYNEFMDGNSSTRSQGDNSSTTKHFGNKLTRSQLTSPSRTKSNMTLSNPNKGPLSLSNPINWLNTYRTDVQRAIDEGRCRDITLNECKELIEKLYEGKKNANERSLKGLSRIPIETMEQFTYRIMEKRYGLRSIAVEHVGMLLKSIEKWAWEDNEVSVFQKIFKNEIEEDFKLIQKELLNSIRDLAKIQIMGRNPSKDSESIEVLVDDKLESGTIHEDEWVDMLSYLYNENDCKTLCILLKEKSTKYNTDVKGVVIKAQESDFGDESAGPEKNSLNNLSPKLKKGSRSYVMGSSSASFGKSSRLVGYDNKNQKDVKRLGYSSPTLKINLKEKGPKSPKKLASMPFIEFIKEVLDFQLRSHQKFLEDYLQLFRSIDIDADGILNAAEFYQCYFMLKKKEEMKENDGEFSLSQEDIESFDRLLKMIDPLQSDKITFSSSVSCLSQSI